jgi:phage-related baseplate assembly protein
VTDRAGPYSLDGLAAAPVPVLFRTNAEQLKADYVVWFEQASGRKLYPMQVEMLLIETLAYAMSVLGQEAQMVAEQHLVAKAGPEGLALLAINRSTPRLPSSRARVNLRLSRVDGVVGPLYIPQGTRVAAGTVRFHVLQPVSIPASAQLVDVEAEALDVGVSGNGFLPGQVNDFLDPVAGVKVENTSVSEGGADDEDIEAWRLRIANAFERISTAGSRNWYREMVMGVSPAIVDVAVIRPQPCYVDLYPLINTGAADAPLRQLVAQAFDTDEVRDIRFGDEVTVKSPVAVAVSPVLTVRTGYGARSTIADDVVAAATAVLSPWRQKLGGVVSPSDVAAAVSALPGVVDVAVAGLDFAVLAEYEFLVVNLVTAHVEQI